MEQIEPPPPTAATFSQGPPPLSAEAEPPKEKIVPIALERLRPSPYNPRVFPPRPSHELVDLAKSIRRMGLIQPATVRPIRADNTPVLPGEDWSDEDVHAYEVVAGERRWRASKMRKGDKGVAKEDGEALDATGPAPRWLPCVIRPLSDTAAMEATAVENLEREGLTPVEEANGVATLMQLYKADVEAVAARLSRPVSWVQQRNRLAKLSKKWRKAIADTDSGFHLWTSAHLVEIARADPAAQDALIDQFRSPVGMSVAQVRGIVTNELRTIGTAPFDVEDSALVPACGACVVCPKTSLSAPGLFEDLGEAIHEPDLRKARCLDSVCWKRKATAAATARLAQLQTEHAHVTVLYEDYGDQYKLPESLLTKAVLFNTRYGHIPLEAVEAGTAGAVPGIYMAGARIGQVVWLRKKKETVRSSGGTTRAAGTPTPLSDRRAQLDRRRKVEAVARIAALIEASKVVPEVTVLLRLAICFGTKERFDSLWSGYDGHDSWKKFESGKMMQVPDLCLLLWQRQCRPVLLSRLTYTGSGCDVAKLFLGACSSAALVGIDGEKILKEATASIQEPKSWTLLNPDGTPKKRGIAERIQKDNAKRKGGTDGKEGQTAGDPGKASAAAGRKGSAPNGKKVGARKVAPQPLASPAAPFSRPGQKKVRP